MNRPCIVSGNVGAAPELRYTPNGKPVTNFRMALYAGQGEDGETITTWVSVSVWGGLAEVVNNKVNKGSKVEVQGYLLPVSVFTRKDGSDGYDIKITGWAVRALEYTPVDLVDLDVDPEAKEELPV